MFKSQQSLALSLSLSVHPPSWLAVPLCTVAPAYTFSLSHSVFFYLLFLDKVHFPCIS